MRSLRFKLTKLNPKAFGDDLDENFYFKRGMDRIKLFFNVTNIFETCHASFKLGPENSSRGLRNGDPII